MNTAHSLLEDLQKTHNHWKSGKKPLPWWVNETGYSKANIRTRYPLISFNPSGLILIDCIYLLQLEYVLKATKHRAIRKQVKCFKYEVLESTLAKLEEKNISSKNQDIILAATS